MNNISKEFIISTLAWWIEIAKPEVADQTTMGHSALLSHLLEGRLPLKDPPPLIYSRGDYGLAGGEPRKHKLHVYKGAHSDYRIMAGQSWKVVETLSDHYILEWLDEFRGVYRYTIADETAQRIDKPEWLQPHAKLYVKGRIYYFATKIGHETRTTR